MGSRKKTEPKELPVKGSDGETDEANDGAAVDTALSKTEKRRRDRATLASKALFRAIDVLWSSSQNACPYITKKIAQSIECVSDVVYDGDISDVCVFDMYRIQTLEKQPAVILIHGGGFTAGDKRYRKGEAQFFALNGFTVFCINYGLAKRFLFPEPLKHVVNCANFIYDNAEKYNIDTDNILIAGDSAGAYYAAMLAAYADNDNLNELLKIDLRCPIKGTLLNCGLYDMNTVLKTKYAFDVDDGVFLNFTGMSKSDFSTFKYKEICMPLPLVNEKFPPTFIIYSKGDTFCKGQGEALAEKFTEQNVYFESYKARHATAYHCFSLVWHGEDASAANELMKSFALRLVNDKIKL